MKIYPIALLAVFINVLPVHSQPLPEGYILQYRQDFSGAKSLADFQTGEPGIWGIYNAQGNYYLHVNRSSINPSSVPYNLAVLNNRIFGDFILEVDVMPLPDTGGFSEICLFIGLKNREQYYCIQLANRCDSIHHGIFLLKNGTLKRLTSLDATPVQWKPGHWQTVRVQRDIVRRTILVYLGDNRQPVLQVKDFELVMGSLGFGSFSGAGQFDNIMIWAPTVIRDE
jgi:hypothetical protein